MAKAHPKITWWMRICRFFRFFHTPLRLRSSIIRLSHNHKRPHLALLCLFVPLPSWYFAVPDQVPPGDIFGNPSLLQIRQRDIVNLRSIPIWRARDTSLRSLYRLYEAIASGNYVALGPETEYFWYQSRKRWALHLIPDPADPELVRYAVLACLVEELVCAFNWRLSLGMRRNGEHQYRERNSDPYPQFVPERLPSWTKNVPPVDRQMVADLPSAMWDSKGKLVLEEGGLSEIFAKRNIVTNVHEIGLDDLFNPEANHDCCGDARSKIFRSGHRYQETRSASDRIARCRNETGPLSLKQGWSKEI